MARATHLLLVVVALAPFPASAELFKCRGADGTLTYSMTPPTTPCYAKGSVPPPPAVKGAAAVSAAKAGPASFPRVDPSTQQARDNVRREILETELETERRLRQAARGDDANHHERNIMALQKEISFLR